jgi:hypothetical protein
MTRCKLTARLFREVSFPKKENSCQEIHNSGNKTYVLVLINQQLIIFRDAKITFIVFPALFLQFHEQITLADEIRSRKEHRALSVRFTLIFRFICVSLGVACWTFQRRVNDNRLDTIKGSQ